jgi:hypothetical protein
MGDDVDAACHDADFELSDALVLIADVEDSGTVDAPFLRHASLLSRYIAYWERRYIARRGERKP